MSAIFTNASNVTQGNKLSVMSATSQSGRRISQRRGPFLYTFEVSINPMNTDSAAYKAVRREIASIDYGVDALTTTIPYLTKDSGSWLGTPVVAAGSQTGRTVLLTGFTVSSTDVIVDGDFIQFANNGKVYQAVGDSSSDVSGNVSVNLNSPLITSPVAASTVSHGTTVTFSLVVNEAEFSVGFTPRNSSDNMSSFKSISFTEVIV